MKLFRNFLKSVKILESAGKRHRVFYYKFELRRHKKKKKEEFKLSQLMKQLVLLSVSLYIC
jgi:hypothetical protein